MKIKVVSEFYDKFHTSTLYKEGEVVDFDEARAKDIIARKLGVKVEEEKPKPAPKPAPKPEPKPEPKKAEAKAEVKEEQKEDKK